MQISDFDVFEYFSSTEKWGDISNLKYYHVRHLDDIRREMGFSFIINCSADNNGHFANSKHYKGIATDGYFKTTMPLISQYMKLEQVLRSLKLDKFISIGIYLDWNSPGFHIDSRGTKARWVKTEGSYLYKKDFIDWVKDKLVGVGEICTPCSMKGNLAQARYVRRVNHKNYFVCEECFREQKEYGVVDFKVYSLHTPIIKITF